MRGLGGLMPVADELRQETDRARARDDQQQGDAGLLALLTANTPTAETISATCVERSREAAGHGKGTVSVRHDIARSALGIRKSDRHVMIDRDGTGANPTVPPRVWEPFFEDIGRSVLDRLAKEGLSVSSRVVWGDPGGSYTLPDEDLIHDVIHLDVQITWTT